MNKTIHIQGNQVGSFNNWGELRLGANHPAFIWQGDKLIFPNPIKDGLLLWYDFKGMRNTDVSRGTAKDLSGNGNHGTLQNFAYNNTSDFKLPDLYKNTKLIVKDPSDPIYSDYPNPPVGAVFNNYNPVSNKINRGIIEMPALANTLIANMKLYHLYNDSVFLENAKIIGDYISSLMRNFSFYGAEVWVVPNRVSLIDGEWTPLYSEINTRSLLQALYALSEVLKETGLYGSEVYQLTQTIGLIHNNIKSRVAEGELRTAMNGAVYEYIYINEDTDALVFSWGEFGISSSDMIAKAMNSYIETMGEDVIYDSQGTEFTPQQILDGAAEHIKAVYDSGTLTMEPTGLPYGFLRADSESETGINWDWVDTQEYGDTWFTNDTTLWIIEGVSRLSQLTEIEGLYNIAKTYRDNFLALRELNHVSYDDKGDTRVIFYDRYNFDGSHLIEDVSISISGTALLWEVDEILGIKDGVLHSQMRDTLEAHIITNKNSDINGAFGWDANDATSFIEMKATGEIYSSPFIQAQSGSSVSSGYKDNTLVFDGVDDEIIIAGGGTGGRFLLPEMTICWSGIIRETQAKSGINQILSAGYVNGWALGYHGQVDMLMYTVRDSNSSSGHSIRYINRPPLGEFFTFAMTFKKGEVTAYLNGAEVNKSVNIGDIIYSTSPSIKIENQAHQTTVSCKIYNHPLTPEEVSHNYAIEKERFDIEGGV